MAELNLKSYEQILDSMIVSLQSRVGLSDDTIGSVTLSFLETAAQSDFLTNSNILAALDSISIDRANGNLLDNIGFAETVSRVPATKSSGSITVLDTSFTKISTQVYSNRPPPIAGATVIYINDGASFPTSGQVYIGRGTAQVEGPLPYGSLTAVGAYYQITLSVALAKQHNTGEAVTLAQGGARVIPAGSTLKTPAAGASTPIQFSTINSATILDGETSVVGVPVLCTQVGSIGNIPLGTLTQFASVPFPGASPSNTTPFTNGTDLESDFNYRDRIKKTRQTRSRGTDVALVNSVLNVIAPDEQKRVSSASVEAASSNLLPTILRIDDGTGYEPIYSGIGNEILIDSALGGEDKLQLNNTPVVKAQLTTINAQPYAIYDDYKIAVSVGGVLSEHSFQTSDFRTPGAATAYEVVASINADTTLLYVARTANGGQKVTILAKSDSNEDIQITIPESGTDANDALAFPTNHQYTLYLYKNNEILTKDGETAEIESAAYPWNLSLTSYTFIFGPDGTPQNTYTFNSTVLSPYAPSNATLSAWVSAFNRTIPGITAISRSNRLVISSNKGESSNASLSIDSASTLVSLGGVFTTLEDTGKDSDYSLIRGSGQIQLSVGAAAGDSFQAGTDDFQGYFQTDAIVGGVFNLAATANLWLITDKETTQVYNAVTIGTTITTSNPSGNIWRYQAPANSFDEVAVGNWAVIWDDSFTASNRGYWRISNCSSTFIDVEKTSGAAQTISITNGDSFIIASSEGIVQQISLASGSYALDTAVTQLNYSLIGATASVVDANKLRVSTNTFLTNGFMALLAADTNGQAIGFNGFVTKTNGIQHIAAIESGNSEKGTPLFTTALVASANNSSTPKVFNATVTQSLHPDLMLNFVKPFGSTRYSSNRFNADGIRNLVSSSLSITIVNKNTIENIVAADRAYVGNGYDFSYDDTLNIVLDNNPTVNTLMLPLSREIQIASSPAPNVNTFSATDVDGGNLSLTVTFGPAYDFSNYRLWSRARQVVNSTGTNNAFILRSLHYGPTGNYYRFGIRYPQYASASMVANTDVTSNGTVDNILYLASGAARTTGIDATSQFSVTVTGALPYVLFINHTGGTPPAWAANGVVAGDILNISATSSFSAALEGSFRISAVSATSLTVTNWAYNGVPANQTVTLSAAADMSIFPLTNNTANNLITFINGTSGISQNLTATLGVGESGAGQIFYSTNDSNTSSFLTLVDGENWVKNCTLTASPQFTTEQNMSITDSLYTEVGELFRLIPYTAKQTATFLDSQAVSNIGNIGGLTQSAQGDKIQINSQLFGTLGAVRATGGNANGVGGSIVGGSTALTNSKLLIRSTEGTTDGLHSGGWIQISTALPIRKSVNFNVTTNMQIVNTANIQIIGGGATFNASFSHAGDATTELQVEKLGKFAAYAYSAGTAPNFSANEGDWVIIDDVGFSNANTGTFRLVRCSASVFWVENEDAVEETVVLAANSDLQFFTCDSILPNDTFILSGDILGASNDGTYTVSEVSAASLTVSLLTPFADATASTSLQTAYNNVQSFDADTSNFYKQISTLQSASSLTSTLTDIILVSGNTNYDSKISDVYESTFTALNKLDFDDKTIFGVDSYSSYRGLIRETSRIVYGRTANPSVYPGVGSAGAYLDIQPPLPRKIVLSIGVRLRTGVSFASITNNVKSVAAGIINNTKIGQSIAFSDILRAVGSIQGIVAAVMIYPVFDASNDLIVVYPQEKPLCDAASDITVTPLSG